MILVTGATGNFGKATIEFLLKKGISADTISALVRDESKAVELKSQGISLKIGDYDNYDSLLQAFQGVDKLLLVSSSDISNRTKQQENAVKAAKQAGVKHIFYTSFERKNETETSPIAFIAKSHLDTESLIKASEISYTIFRNNLYLDVLPMFFGENVLETGIFYPAGETKSAFALRDDMAEATANVLASEGHENKAYSFSNTENISLVEIAEMLSEIAGRDIKYSNPSKENYIEVLSKTAIPTEYLDLFVGFAEAIQQDEFSSKKTDLENLLGRKPTNAKDFLTQLYGAK